MAKLGHPLVCYNDTGCRSNLRTHRCGAVHFPVMLHFLNELYSVLREYSNVKVIDTTLGTDDWTKLMSLTKTIEYFNLLSNDVETSYEQSQSGCSLTILIKLRQPNLESQLMIDYAGTISRLEKLIKDFAVHVCVSYERHCQRKNVSCIELSEGAISSDVWLRLLSCIKLFEGSVSSDVWLRLLASVICTNPEANSEHLYICNHCKPQICSNELPWIANCTCATRVE